MTNDAALARHATLIGALRAALARSPAAAQPTGHIELIETHISSVLLAGDLAYKIKKPVDLGFVDFTTPARRRFFCEEELRLNRRTAPRLYLDVVPITGTETQPVLGDGDRDHGAPIDYAVRMRRFAHDALLDCRARAGQLSTGEIDRLAQAIADFHAGAQRAAPDSPLGAPDLALRWVRDNFPALRAAPLGPELATALDRLSDWVEREFGRRHALMTQRRAAGFVRECHGDLHLGNIVLLDGCPTPFDAIEFNPQLRWIDVVSDLAFAFMDLLDHGLARFAWRLVDRYLQSTGDYAGLGVLRFYAVYRALVRAKVARIRAEQSADEPARGAARAACTHYVHLAAALARPAPLLLVLTCGVSGTGKTTVAGQIAECLGGVRIRSDVERKRLFGVAPAARTAGAAHDALYSTDATRQTYARLADLAATVADAGIAAVVDAAFLRRHEREAFRALAQRLGARFALIECTAAPDVLRERVARRLLREADASDATLAVLERQLATHEPVTAAERADGWRVATDVDAATLDARCAEIAAGMRSN